MEFNLNLLTQIYLVFTTLLIIRIIIKIERFSQNPIIKKVKNWEKEMWNSKYKILFSIFFVIIATLIDYISGVYVTNLKGTPASDIILNLITPIDLNFLFAYGYLFTITILFVYPIIFKPKKLSRTINQFSLLLIIRSFFISLTHLKTPLTAIPIRFPAHLAGIVFQNDLFFSGHTSIPFLGFLIFKNSKIKYFFLASSIILGSTSLLMHRHYSIDVFAAFFICYGSYKMGEFLFEKIKI